MRRVFLREIRAITNFREKTWRAMPRKLIKNKTNNDPCTDCESLFVDKYDARMEKEYYLSPLKNDPTYGRKRWLLKVYILVAIVNVSNLTTEPNRLLVKFVN